MKNWYYSFYLFKEIMSFEVKYRLKRLSTYVYFCIFFIMAFMFIFGESGVLRFMNIQQGKKFINAPQTIFMVVSIWSFLGILVVSAIMSGSVFRDFEHRMHPLYFTKTINKFSYLAGRFIGGYLTLILIFSSCGLGIFFALLLPIYNPELLGQFSLRAYLQPYLVMMVPNLFFLGAIFFALTVFFRKQMPVHIATIILVAVYIGIGVYAGDMDNRFIAALIDPFGFEAVGNITRYWSVAEKNVKIIPFEGVLLLNRMIWTTVAFIVLCLSFFKFQLSQFLTETQGRRSAKKSAPHDMQTSLIAQFESIPAISRDFSFGSHLRLLIQNMWIEFFSIVKSKYFIIIIFTGMLLIGTTSSEIGKMYGTETYPVTYQVLSSIAFRFIIFVLLIITIYSGELVWKERNRKMNQIYDAIPVPDWVWFLSKLFALMLLQVVLLLLIMLTGIVIQTFAGYTHYEFSLYIKELFGFRLLYYWLLCMLAMAIQVTVNNKYLGHFVMVLYYLSTVFAFQFGLENKMYLYASSTAARYSDMNGYGHFAWPYYSFQLYWLAFAFMLSILSYLLWMRGVESGWKQRFNSARQRFTVRIRVLAGIFALIFLCLGINIYYNTHILNTFRSSWEIEKLQADYEKSYKQYETITKPRLIDVTLKVDIFPKKRAYAITGQYSLTNQTHEPINTLHITMPSEEIVINKMVLDRHFTVTHKDPNGFYYIYDFEKPLVPGNSMILDFDLEYCRKGFENDNSSDFKLLGNGTFFRSAECLPAIGYWNAVELTTDFTRKRHGLEPKERLPPVDDLDARMNTAVCNYADWINYDATISTSSDQMAFTIGNLIDEWQDGDRRYFHYKPDSPIRCYLPFLSAKYQVRQDKWHDVDVAVYYHQGHEYNLDRMINGVKKSLDYYSSEYGPYPHKTVRILEIPRFHSYAQSFPTTIPFSEGIGFIAKVEEGDVDYPFNVTAHEMAHQWWAHQVTGGYVQGFTFLTETMAQYSCLMVSKREYDDKTIRKYLKHELDSYLRGRSFEQKKEVPIILVENQSYIHYNKSSLVMNAMQDYMGESNLNAVLAEFLRDKAFQNPPYTNSLEFIDYLKRAVPEKLQHTIEDLFETITLYDNEILKATYSVQDDGAYLVKLSVKVKKKSC